MKYRSSERLSAILPQEPAPEGDGPACTRTLVLRKLLSLTFSLAACAELLEQQEAERVISVIAEIEEIMARLRDAPGAPADPGGLELDLRDGGGIQPGWVREAGSPYREPGPARIL